MYDTAIFYDDYLIIALKFIMNMMSLKYYFSYNSFIRKNIPEISLNYYDVTNVFDNDRSAIMSWIYYVERTEARRSFLNIF